MTKLHPKDPRTDVLRAKLECKMGAFGSDILRLGWSSGPLREKLGSTVGSDAQIPRSGGLSWSNRCSQPAAPPDRDLGPRFGFEWQPRLNCSFALPVECVGWAGGYCVCQGAASTHYRAWAVRCRVGSGSVLWLGTIRRRCRSRVSVLGHSR